MPEPSQMKEIITCCGARFLPKMPSAQKVPRINAYILLLECTYYIFLFLLQFLLLFRSTLWWCHVSRTGRFVIKQWVCHCRWSAQSFYWLAFCSRDLTCRPILSLPLSTHPVSLQPPKLLPGAEGSSDNDIGKDFLFNTLVPVCDRIWYMDVQVQIA